MRDEKEERKKQARSNKTNKAKQHSTPMYSYCKILLVYQAIATNIFNAVVIVYLVLLQGLKHWKRVFHYWDRAIDTGKCAYPFPRWC